MNEESIKKKYPNVDLHGIEKNRVCMSTGQLKKIFDLNSKEFNNKFLMACEQKLIKKKQKSLDYYDVSIIINECLKRESTQIDINMEKKHNDSQNYNLNERIEKIEKRLDEVEQMVRDFLVN